MEAITEQELAEKIEDAFNMYSNVVVEPGIGRKQQAILIAKAVAEFVIGRKTIVTGTSASGGPVTGEGIIQE